MCLVHIFGSFVTAPPVTVGLQVRFTVGVMASHILLLLLEKTCTCLEDTPTLPGVCIQQIKCTLKRAFNVLRDRVASLLTNNCTNVLFP